MRLEEIHSFCKYDKDIWQSQKIPEEIDFEEENDVMNEK